MKSRNLIPCLLFGFAVTFQVQAQTITTVGGNTSWSRVNNVSVDSAGNLYAADFNGSVVYKVTPQGATTVYAGTLNKPGNAGDGGPATSATLNGPLGTAMASDGTLYIADYNNEKIRKVSPSGVIYHLRRYGRRGLDRRWRRSRQRQDLRTLQHDPGLQGNSLFRGLRQLPYP